MKIQFTIPGNPVPKARPRVTRSGHTYTPKRTADYEKTVRLFAKNAMAKHGMEPLEKAVRLIVMAFFPVPASWTKAKREKALSGEIKPIVRPDWDNVVKAVQDALNGIVYKDDCQITDICGGKRYSAVPCVEVVIEAADEMG